MAHGASQIDKADEEPGGDATLQFVEGSDSFDDQFPDGGLIYEDFDFGPSDDDVRATLQPGKRSTRKLEFSNLFGDNDSTLEAHGDNGLSAAISNVETATTALNAAAGNSGMMAALDSLDAPIADLAFARRGTDPLPPMGEMEGSSRAQGASAAPQGSNTAPAKASVESAGGESAGGESASAADARAADASGAIDTGDAPFAGNRGEGRFKAQETASNVPSKAKPRLPLLVAVGVVVVVAIVAVAMFAFGGSGFGYWSERVELGTVDYVDWRTGNPVRPSEELVFEKGDKREFLAPNVAGYKAIEARANGKNLKLVQSDSGKGNSKTNIIEGLSPWPENEKSEITVLYAKEVEYTVKYLEDGSNAELAPGKTVTTNVSGDEVTEKAVDIEGYEPASDAEVKLTLLDDDEKNTITFTYKKAAVKSSASANSNGYSATNLATTGNSSKSKANSQSSQASQEQVSSTAESSSSTEEEAASEAGSEGDSSGDSSGDSQATTASDNDSKEASGEDGAAASESSGEAENASEAASEATSNTDSDAASEASSDSDSDTATAADSDTATAADSEAAAAPSAAATSSDFAIEDASAATTDSGSNAAAAADAEPKAASNSEPAADAEPQAASNSEPAAASESAVPTKASAEVASSASSGGKGAGSSAD